MLSHQKIKNITNKELEKLIEERKDGKNKLRKMGVNLDDLLVGMYSDPSHFVYEILQNAEDAGAEEVKFELFKDRLDIHHNGKDFDIKDVVGVASVGHSRKKEDFNSIGKFGVGFKSVYDITKTPHIFSGGYKIKIEDFTTLLKANCDEQIDKTLIRLPFNCNKRSPEETFSLISKKLENIGMKTLLFLKNIKVIQWQTPTSNGNYSKSTSYFKEAKNTKKVTVRSDSFSEEYIVIGKPIRIDGIKTKKGTQLRVEVAYKIGKNKKGKKIIIPESDSKLVVFFPTDKDTYLNFAIQGPYKTTPSRENIPLDDEQNKIIIEETGNLVAESLSIIKDLGYLDVDFLNLLPIKLEHMDKQIYPVIYQKVKEKLLLEKLLPTSDYKYTKAENSLLAGVKGLAEFLDSKDIKKIFIKENWLDTNITENRTRELRDYLINELKVKEVEFEDFAQKVDAEFLQTKTDRWMINFYKRLLGQNALWNDSNYPPGILRSKPIIRLETNEHIAPFDDRGKIQVYLPSETKSKYKTVKRILANDENSKKFLNTLGIKKPDLFDEIKEYIFPKYQIDNPAKDKEYFEDIKKLLRAYETIQVDKRDEFIDELSKASFIDSVNNITGEHYLRKPSEVYFNDNDLKEYFNGYNSVYFVPDELYKKFSQEKLKPFLRDLDVEDKPRLIEIPINWSWEEKNKLHDGKGYCRDFLDYEYEGLENFVRKITTEKSLLFWKLLLKNIKNLSGQGAENFFKGKYIWDYHGSHNEYLDTAKFLITLRTQAWLADKNNNFEKPCNITFSELSDRYIKEGSNIAILLKALEFKSEAVDRLPEDQRRKLEITKDFTPEEIERALSEHKKKLPGETEKIWMSKYEPGTFNAEIVEVEPDKIVNPDLTGQGNTISTLENEDSIVRNKESTEKDTKISSVDRKAIGDCGEKQVYYELKEKYQKTGSITETDSGFKVEGGDRELFEIVWLNKHSDKGRGCDFIIKRNGKGIEYIEVKTKTQENAELIEVTGTQWEFARSLFEKDEGDKYFFYVVLYDKKRILKYKNPIKLWKEGKLYAHPVNFEL